MADPHLPFDAAALAAMIARYPTPFHLYDEAAIRTRVKRLYQAFSWAPAGFKNYYAVKACPNPNIVGLLQEAGCGADCSSLAELVLAERLGIRGEEIMFSSNNTPALEYQTARDLGAIINLDDIGHIALLEQHGIVPELICGRWNPGPLIHGNGIIGQPEEAKFGMTEAQLVETYRHYRNQGLRRFGFHAMVVSNETRTEYFIDLARLIFECVSRIAQQLDIAFEFVNLGGGFGIPYRPSDHALDIERVAEGIAAQYRAVLQAHGLTPKLFLENGRFLTGPCGYLVTTVRHVKHTYKHFIGVDASMADLMRPGMYDAYHHITVVGKEQQPHDKVYDVVGSLCENNDKFAVDRPLPSIAPNDQLVIHDTGAHGHAMGFNYNGQLRSAELLLTVEQDVRLIRRAETLADYFATCLNLDVV